MIWPYRRRRITPGPVRQVAEAMSAPPPAAPLRGTGFTPTQPRQGVRSLLGRSAELSRILQALRDDRAHVVLYSERGRGKTSLINAAIERLRQSGTVVARTSCLSDSTFDGIIRDLVGNLPSSMMPSAAPAPGEGCAAALPVTPIRTADVAALPGLLGCRDLVFMIDEFDRVVDPATAPRLADTMKLLSDRALPLRFVIVGVSENLEQMLAQHQSVQRNIVALQLPLLLNTEVTALLVQAAAEMGATVPAAVIDQAVGLARGSPHQAQLIGLRLMQAATARGGGGAVGPEDLDRAVDVLLLEASPHDAGLWTGLTANGTDAEMVAALRRLATVEQDAWGRLLVLPTKEGGAQVGPHRIGPVAWTRIEAAEVLRGSPPGSGMFIFRRRSTLHYILALSVRLPPLDDAGSRLEGEPESGAMRLIALGRPA